MLAKYQAAEALVLAGKSAAWGDRAVTLADLPEIRAGRLEFERRVNAANRRAAGDRSSARYRTASFT